MQKYLLDVNVLIAMVHQQHVHHRIALSWFLEISNSNKWLTCPITEAGLLRIMSNPAFDCEYDRPYEVARHLELIKDRFPNNEFLPNDISIMNNDIVDLPLVLSSKNLTDAYLLGTAYKNGAKLATLDKRITNSWLKNKNADAIEYL